MGNLKTRIAGVAMITPVGGTAKMTAASVRAGINQYQDSDFFDQSYEPVKMARVPDEAIAINLEMRSIESADARQVRLLQLAGAAILDLVPALPGEEKIPVFMAGPEPVAGNGVGIGVPFLRDLALVSDLNIDIQNSRCINTGRAGGIDAIRTAFNYLEVSQQRFALVGGVDTFNDLDVVSYYLNEGRILVPSGMDGFVPGEGAAFLLLEVSDGPAGEKRVGRLLEPAICREPGNMLSSEHYRGDGLASAFSQALRSVTPDSVTRIYSSMNGESHFAKELGVAVIRNSRYINDNCITFHPADSFGDLGAATGVVLTGLASLDIQADEKAGFYLIYSSSDSESRGAVCLAK